MGAAATVEIQKPPDASDIVATQSLDFARAEIMRLRKELGHLAQSFNMTVLSMDASDLVLGLDEEEDFMRCVKEISHIRKCLLLNTQASIRRQTQMLVDKPIIRIQSEEEKDCRPDLDDQSSDDSDASYD
jgi:hypothetical protein